MAQAETKQAPETPEEIAHDIVAMFYDGAQYPSRFAAYSHILSALRNEREAHKLSEREKQVLIDHHNYEAEKAITRLGCRISERYHRDRAAAIRKGE